MQPPQPPLNFETTPTLIANDTESEINKTRCLWDSIVRSVTPENATYSNTIFPIALNRTQRARKLMPYLLLSKVSPDPDLRDAGRQNSKLTSDASAQDYMRRDVAALVDAVWQKQLQGHEALDREDAWTLERMHMEFKNAGANIEDEAARKRYIELHEECTALAQAAKKAFGDDDYGVWLTREELAGVPESLLSKMQINEEGMLKATFQKNSHITVMRYASRASTRKELSAAREARFPENIERLERLIDARKEMSKILGFQSHGERQIVGRLVASERDVIRQLNECMESARSTRDAETEKLTLVKQEYLQTYDHARTGVKEDDEVLNFWDQSFYDTLLKQNEYQVDAKRLGEYFEVRESLNKALVIYGSLFQMRFEVVNIPKWHEDVQAFSVWNDQVIGGEFLGYLYIDMYSRHGKPKGAFAGVIQPGHRDRSQTFYGSQILSCSFARPSEHPTLLQHSELTTLFHELGHCINKLVTRTKFYEPSTRDFAEVPSILFEKWIWLPSVLVPLSRHWSHLPEYQETWRKDHPGEDLPDEKLPAKFAEDLHRTRMVNGAHSICNQVRLAMFDMAIHGKEEVDLRKTWNDLRRETGGLNIVDGNGFAGFSHVFSGYDAGYYCYPLARVWANDLWKKFEADPMNPAVGLQFRKALLEGGKPEAEGFLEFLGRAPTVDAYFEDLLRSSPLNKAQM